jgi:superkiller protein 3
VIALRPAWPEGHFNLGLALRLQGEVREAVQAFREAIRLQPNYARAHMNLARCLTTCGDRTLRNPREALAAARKGVDLAPGSDLAWLVLGWAQYRVGEWKASVAALKKSMELQKAPKGGAAGQWFFLAMAHRRLGNQEEARRWYNRAVGWMDQHAAGDAELQRIRTEAAELFKVEGVQPK